MAGGGGPELWPTLFLLGRYSCRDRLFVNKILKRLIVRNKFKKNYNFKYLTKIMAAIWKRVGITKLKPYMFIL